MDSLGLQTDSFKRNGNELGDCSKLKSSPESWSRDVDTKAR